MWLLRVGATGRFDDGLPNIPTNIHAPDLTSSSGLRLDGYDFKQPTGNDLDCHGERIPTSSITRRRMDSFTVFAPRNGEWGHEFAIPRAARELVTANPASRDRRAQGMPGARCTRSLACK